MNKSGPAIGPIACVTVAASDLAAVEACYADFLGYRTVGRGSLEAELARLWDCPRAAGSKYLLMAPERGDDFVFRFIQSPASSRYTAFASHGWNAAELIVRNVDALAERLSDSPFRVVGAPQNLSFSDDIRAMQVVGPGGELLYLTEIKRAVPGLDAPQVRCDVDRVFIVILGGPSMSVLQNFYAEKFGVEPAPAVESRVKGMSAAFGFSPEHKYPIAALKLAGQSLIEVDEMPAEAEARMAAEGLLPPGIAMVSFVGASGDAGGEPQAQLAPPPYRGRWRAGFMSGPTAEKIEILAPV